MEVGGKLFKAVIAGMKVRSTHALNWWELNKSTVRMCLLEKWHNVKTEMRKDFVGKYNEV